MFGFLENKLMSTGLADWIGLDGNDQLDNQFSSWLPYQAYSVEHQQFINRGGNLGFMLEVLPQSGADEQMVEVMVSLYANCPPNTGVQFHLFGSPIIRSKLLDYANQRSEDADQYERSLPHGRPIRNENLFRKLARQRVGHLLRGATESLSSFPFTVRDFRLMMSVTMPGDRNNHEHRVRLRSLRDSMSATLAAASMQNIPCDASALINWCAPLLNPNRLGNRDLADLMYDEGRPLSEQMVDRDTIQDATDSGIVLSKPGHRDVLEARFLSVKGYPKNYALWQMGGLIGDLVQPALQYRGPFMLSMGVMLLDHNTAKATVTSNHIRATQNAGSKMAAIMPDVAKKEADWKAVADAVDVGGSMVSMYHQLALFAPPSQATAAEEAARAVWRSKGYDLNADVFLHRQALLASLPMTLTPGFFQDLKKMKRVTRKQSSNAIHLMPVIAEWRGTKTPTLVLAGRRGQLMTMDLYDNDMGNYNAAVIGAPGSGKSVLLNDLAWSYLSIGAQVRMMDLGKSFEKLCRKANGTYIEFTPASKININPFPMVNDIAEDIEMLIPLIAKMCSMRSTIGEVQYAAISFIIMRLYERYGKDMTFTAMRDECKTGSIKELKIVNDPRIKDMAIMLSPYAKGGQYERFFDGPNNVDLSNDLVVIENEELKRKPDLHASINMLLMYQITGEMFLNRSRKKLLIIDELKQQLGEIGGDDKVKAAVVEETARRARKQDGSLVTATQMADDFYSSEQMQSAFNCSDWVFCLRQKPESIELLQRNGRLSMDDTKKRLLNSLRTEPGCYSEMYIESPVGQGIGRLVLDPATHLLFSNRPEDNKPIDALRARGMSIDKAIETVLASRAAGSAP